MTEPAVSKSPRTMDTVTAVASSTATDSFPCSRAFSPSLIYFTDLIREMIMVTGAGKNSRETIRHMTAEASLSSNSRFRARVVCSGTSPSSSAVAKEKAASARITAPRSSR